MRPLLSALAAAALLASTALALAESCARPPEKAAFDVAGLKSELMVVAIACQQQDRYNQFVTRFRSDLQGDERSLNGYFARTGARAQQRHDDYITNLANTQSEDGIKQGTLFCDQHKSMFDEVLALKDGHDLPGYATAKGLVQPVEIIECPAPAALRKKLRTASEK